ncbi:hypothetical protein [Saprospira grandis]|uniref:Uncharacterized protein n=1 Tax=Saprospira grandis (strain Lewin) TaxID=984262 RepID=H6L6B4_SAPGL|nr:hypothetical protein [Saprospira grandis]AFC23015.1 hypothetical protein SGRA_0276 [Saprospira grandis str. Lewin]
MSTFKLDWWKLLSYFLGLSTLGGTPLLLWEVGEWMEEPQTSAAPLALNQGPEKKTYPLIDSIEADEWEEELRSSDLEKERPVAPPADQPKTAPATPKYVQSNRPEPDRTKRLGCICMDEEQQDLKGRGACSGHGGVRYWVYAQANSDVLLRYPTERHELHPQALSTDELSQLAAHQEDLRQPKASPEKISPKDAQDYWQKKRKQQEGQAAAATPRLERLQIEPQQQQQQRMDQERWNFYQLVIIFMVCVTIAFVTYTMFRAR